MNLKGSGLYIILLISAAFLTYFNTLAGEFTTEDHYIITGNPFIGDFRNAPVLFDLRNLFNPVPITVGARPMTVFSLMADHVFWGENPRGYRFTNIILHSVCGILVFLTLGAMKISREVSFLGALIFTLHPINAEVVNVPGFRGELLVTAFYLSCFIILLYLFNNRVSVKKTALLGILSAVFLLFALTAKEIAATFPVLFLVLLALKPGKNLKLNPVLKPLGGGLLVSSFLYVIFFWMRRYSYNMFQTVFVSIPGGVRPFDSLLAYFNTIFVTFYMYMRNIFFPFFLSYEYQITIDRITAASVFGALAAAAVIFILFKTTDRKLKISLLFFIITYLPVSNIIPLHNTLSDRYMYLPLAGAVYAVFRLAALLSGPVVKKLRFLIPGVRPGYLAVLFFIVLLNGLTFNRNFRFLNTLGLYEHSYKHAPQNPRAGYNLGLAYSENGLYEDSNRVLFELNDRNPRYAAPRVWHILARNFLMMGNPEKSASYLKKTALLNPTREIIDELRFVLETGGLKQL